MGETKQHLTFRFSEDTLKQLAELQDAFWPFAEDRASTLRIIVQLVYALLFTPATLRDLLAVLQRLHCSTLSHTQLTIDFPPACPPVPFRPKLWQQGGHA
jgi:hypothetical protein